ncbi:MAG: beta strand repeat-containing protein [Gaiellaceae bacterium]
MGERSWIGRSVRFACLGLIAALVAVAGLAGSATPAPPPVVMTDVCVNPSRGQMSFPIGGTCPAGYALVAVDDPGATFAACYLNSNGAIRKLPAGSECTSAPRSKKETAITVPSLTEDLYLCASNSDGALFFKGTSPATCKSGQFLVVIEQANTPPVANDATVSVNEDASVQITLSASDADGQNLSFSIVSGQGPLHGELGALVPVTPSTATVTYTPSANYFGPDSFKFRANDGFANSNDATVSITVIGINDAPSFTAGADQTVNEDASAQTVNNWATLISAGPGETQTLTFTVSNDNNALFSSQPAISPTGTLTYTPAADANGSATVSVFLMDDGGTANGGDDTSGTQQFTITVNAVNDPPSFTGGGNVTVAEDSGAYSAGWATAISPGPADESGQTVTFVVSNDNNALFSVQPAIASNGTLSYTSAANANGSATVTVTAQDSAGASSVPQIFTITVTAVNDAPSFDLPASPNQTVVQDSGPQTVAGFATNISAGPSDESGQTLTFNVSNDKNALFAAQPAIDASGELTFESASGAAGTALVSVSLSDDGGTAGGGDDTSATQQFTITVVPLNAAPVAAGQTVAATEDTQKTITLTATDADDDNLSFSIVASPTKGSLDTIDPADCTAVNTCTATVDYTPAANENGADSFTFKANDSTVDSSTATVGINIAAVNDAPSFSSGGDVSVNEDSGAYSAGWATSISPGPNESGQTVSFNVSNDNNALFSAQPAVSPTGVLTFTPAANAFGSATVSVFLSDNGGTANGGDDTSGTQQFTITVTGINDAPSFTKGADQTVAEDAGAQSVTGWATGISPGPNESGQTVSFSVSNDNNALFSAQPAVSPSGTLTYTPAANQNGSATITLRATDDGGTANGGVDASPTQTFGITVTAVNDPPVAQAKSYGAQANMKITGLSGLLSGVTDADAGVNGCSPSFMVASVGPTTSPAGGIVSNVNASTGTFDFDPPPGVTGNVTFSYTVQDSGCPGTATSAPATITVNVAGPVVWFVNSAVGSNGTGTLSSPFNVLSAADAVDAANHGIFLYSSATNYTGALTLNAGEKLIGQPTTGTTFDSIFGVSPPTGTIARPTLGSGTVTMTGTVTLANSTTLRGLALFTGASTGLTDPASALTGVDVDQTSVATTTGTGLALSDIGGTVKLAALTSNGGTGANLTGSNSGATFDFTGVAISSGANPGLAATGGGTIRVTGTTNTIATSTGTALNVANTTIGSSGLTFQSIDSDGGSSTGIILDNTGSTAGLTVTGTGTAGSGGTIANKTGADGSSSSGIGIYLNNTKSPSFTRMQLNDFQNFAIRGSSVSGFTLADSVVSGSNGNNAAVDEGSVYFTNLTGSASLSGNAISGGWEDNLNVTNTSGTLDRITVSGPNCTIGLNSTSFGNDGVHFESHNTSTVLNSTVQNCTFTGARGDWYFAATIANGSSDAAFASNTLSNAHTNTLSAGARVAVSANGPTTFNIHDNTLQGSVGHAILANAAASQAVASGGIEDNTIGVLAVPNSGSSQASGIAVESSSGGGDMVALVDGNTVRQYNGHGILLEAGDQMGNPLTFQATVTNNAVGTPGTLGPLATGWNGIHLNNGILAADNFTSCVDIRSNSVAGSGAGAISPNNNDVRLRQRQATTVRLPGYLGANNDNAAVQTFLGAQNTLVTVNASNTVPTGGGYIGGAACTQPS